jgi:lipopolysaccharide transport system ATP-binding protein
MSKRVIEVENLSKRYQLGVVSSKTFSSDFRRLIKSRFTRKYFEEVQENDRTQVSNSEFVWALRDVSFSVNEGESLAIIGRNGAGKSTLLKLLSQITTPTTGQIRMKGRVSSLLEVGTGFHPELSGKENIFLNGAILGMSKQEVKHRFEEIVEFSGIQRYIDTPVKRYSSGMYVRLAFAVAAHLESEIMIVDEVLSVGDAEFQKKCLGKMNDVTRLNGRTVLFVSHNLAAVKTLCSRGLVISNGTMKFDGIAAEAISNYMSFDSKVIAEKFNYINFENVGFKLNSLRVFSNDSDKYLFDSSEINLEIDFDLANQDISELTFHIKGDSGDTLFSFESYPTVLLKGHNRLLCKIPPRFLLPGSYFLDLLIIEKRIRCAAFEKDICMFQLIHGNREIGEYYGSEPGFIHPTFEWSNDTNFEK